jgi:hypothetical protein
VAARLAAAQALNASLHVRLAAAEGRLAAVQEESSAAHATIDGMAERLAVCQIANASLQTSLAAAQGALDKKTKQAAGLRRAAAGRAAAARAERAARKKAAAAAAAARSEAMRLRSSLGMLQGALAARSGELQAARANLAAADAGLKRRTRQLAHAAAVRAADAAKLIRQQAALAAANCRLWSENKQLRDKTRASARRARAAAAAVGRLRAERACARRHGRAPALPVTPKPGTTAAAAAAMLSPAAADEDVAAFADFDAPIEEPAAGRGTRLCGAASCGSDGGPSDTCVLVEVVPFCCGDGGAPATAKFADDLLEEAPSPDCPMLSAAPPKRNAPLVGKAKKALVSIKSKLKCMLACHLPPKAACC